MELACFSARSWCIHCSHLHTLLSELGWCGGVGTGEQNTLVFLFIPQSLSLFQQQKP